jgi:hypothetical protein
MQFWTKSGSMLRAAIILVVAALAGCESKVSVELGTQAPAQQIITQVLVNLEGVEFRKSGGGTESLVFDEPEQVELIGLQGGNFSRLFTDEELSDGSYTGVRLLLVDGEDNNDRNRVIVDGEEVDLALGTLTNFSEVDFTVDKDDSSSDTVVLTLDLTLSLPFDEDADAETLTLTPVLRAVRSEDAGGVAGNVTVNCPSNSALAIYLFSGNDITPDDQDQTEPNPYLTNAIRLSQTGPSTGYEFPFLPEGRYTLASTCRADEENPGANDDLDFRNVTQVEVEAETNVTQNIPD